MLSFIKNSGITGWLVVLILLINVLMFFINARRLKSAAPEDSPRILYGVNAILFWGVICCLIGFIGQYMGMYQALLVIAKAETIDPNMVAEGCAISFTTTILGLTALLFSGLGWFVLQGWHRKKAGLWNRSA